MSQLKHSTLTAPALHLPEQLAGAPSEELQHVNEDVAAARHLTAIRIRGQLAEPDGEEVPV